MAKLNHVFGNYFSLVIPLVKRTRTVIDGTETDTDTEYTPSPSESVSVRLIRRKGRAFSYIPTVEGSQVTIEDEGKLPLGTYDVEVVITGGEHPMRFCDEATIEVHNATEAAGIVPGETLTATTYTLQGAVFFAMGSGGGDSGITLYYVNVTNNGDDTYTADKTFTEIKAAYENGNLVFVKYNGAIMNLVGFMQDSFVLFSQAGGSIITTIMIGSRDEVLFATHSLPTRLSDLQNDLLFATQQWVISQRYLTEHQSLDGYATQQWVNNQNFLKEHQSLDGYATQQWVNEQNFLKQHQDISGKENRMQIVVPNSLSFAAETGKYYRITQSGTITVTLPSVVSDYIEGFLLFFTAAADDCIHFDTQDTVLKADGYEIKAGDICEVNAVCNSNGWQITVVKFNS